MQNPSRSWDVAVVGGGVIGLAVAWRAARHGLAVTLLERGEPGRGTSYAAAGMLAPIAEADPGEQPLLALGLAAARAYPGFVAELTDASGRDPGYLQCGSLLAARDADEAEWLTREQAMRERLGLSVRRLRPSEARRLEPGLAPTLRGALEFPADHVIDPRLLSDALSEALHRAGGLLRAGCEVERLLVDDGVVEGVGLAGGERVSARQVVVASGPWSGSSLGLPPEARVPVRPVKGQSLRLHDPAGPGLLGRVLRMPAGYVAPRGDGRYVLGATMEERGFDTTVTAGAVFELLRDAIELLPGLSELVIDELLAGLRPGTPDNLPVIGSGAIDGLLWATGHHRGGILMAPVTAELVLAGLTGEEPAARTSELSAETIAACSPSRFAAVAVGT
jgi:glycine oxidase